MRIETEYLWGKLPHNKRLGLYVSCILQYNMIKLRIETPVLRTYQETSIPLRNLCSSPNEFRNLTDVAKRKLTEKVVLESVKKALSYFRWLEKQKTLPKY